MEQWMQLNLVGKATNPLLGWRPTQLNGRLTQVLHPPASRNKKTRAEREAPPSPNTLIIFKTLLFKEQWLVGNAQMTFIQLSLF